MPPWSPRARVPGPCTADDLAPAARTRLDELARRYDVAPIFRACGPVERDESLYVLDLLDRFVGAPPASRALDVGAKNGAYLPGLAAFSPRGWDAVELDADRRYWNLRTRRAVGEAMAAACPPCRFVAGDVRDLPGPYALVTWLLPFVYVEPHRSWGLAARSFDPPAVLAHVLAFGAPVLIVNQGDQEHGEQRRLLGEAPARDLGEIDSVFSPFRKRRLGWLVGGAADRPIALRRRAGV